MSDLGLLYERSIRYYSPAVKKDQIALVRKVKGYLA